MIAYLDANIVIYLVERDPSWGSKALVRVASLRVAGDEIAVSDAARLECLVGPFLLGDAATVADYATFFSDPAVRVFPLTAKVCEEAARIRASFNFKPLDALHLAAAQQHGCTLFLTNDVPLARYTGLTVEILA